MSENQIIDFSPSSKARQKIREEFNHPRWKLFKKWFFENFNSQEKRDLQEEFYIYCEFHNKIIPFVPWFVSKHVENYISIVERNYQLSNGKIVKTDRKSVV